MHCLQQQQQQQLNKKKKTHVLVFQEGIDVSIYQPSRTKAKLNVVTQPNGIPKTKMTQNQIQQEKRQQQ